MNFSFFFFALSFAFRETKAKANSTPISNTREVSSGLKHCANSGKTEESCRMQCNWDGSCIEIVETRTCTCNGDSKIKTFSTVFKVTRTIFYTTFQKPKQKRGILKIEKCDFSHSKLI